MITCRGRSYITMLTSIGHLFNLSFLIHLLTQLLYFWSKYWISVLWGSNYSLWQDHVRKQSAILVLFRELRSGIGRVEPNGSDTIAFWDVCKLNIKSWIQNEANHLTFTKWLAIHILLYENTYLFSVTH